MPGLGKTNQHVRTPEMKIIGSADDSARMQVCRICAMTLQPRTEQDGTRRVRTEWARVRDHWVRWSNEAYCKGFPVWGILGSTPGTPSAISLPSSGPERLDF